MENEYGLNEEACVRLLNEILDINDAGGFSDPDNPPDSINYGTLVTLFAMRGIMDGIDELFDSLYDFAIAAGKNSIKRKYENGERIKVYFLLYAASEWNCDSLYKLMKKDPRFDVKIVLSYQTHISNADALFTYEKSRIFFKNNNYDFFEVLDNSTMSAKGWDDIGGFPDILVHLTSWNGCMPEEYQLVKLPFTTLNAYIPYALSTVDNPDRDYVREAVCNMPFMNFMWKLFMPFEQENISDVCVCCGKPAKAMVYWGKAY